MSHLPALYGVIAQPRSSNIRPIKEGRRWCFDNDCFGGTFDLGKWWATVQKLLPYRRQCDFIVLPDAVGKALQTKSLWYQWLQTFQSLKLPLAYVAQNGQGSLDIPENADVLFIGGDDTFKLGDEGRACVEAAKRRGMRIHMGRVNSLKRLRYAKSIGCDSVDGTYICYGKDINTPKLTAMMRSVANEIPIPVCG